MNLHTLGAPRLFHLPAEISGSSHQDLEAWQVANRRDLTGVPRLHVVTALPPLRVPIRSVP